MGPCCALAAPIVSARGRRACMPEQRLHRRQVNARIEKITVQGDRATVNYVEPDGDKEKLGLVKQDGRWKVSVPMPKGTMP